MERLTKNLNPIYVLTEEMEKEYITDKIKKLTNKLGEYEDLEEQIGCPLEVIIKAQINKKIYVNSEYYKDKTCEIEISKDNFFPNFEFKSFTDDYMYDYYFKDYKKTWWLKEDRSE